MWQTISRWLIQKLIINLLTAVGKYIPAIVEDWKRKKQREIVQEEAKKELDEKLKEENLSPEEKAKAYAKYQNSGR